MSPGSTPALPHPNSKRRVFRLLANPRLRQNEGLRAVFTPAPVKPPGRHSAKFDAEVHRGWNGPS